MDNTNNVSDVVSEFKTLSVEFLDEENKFEDFERDHLPETIEQKFFASRSSSTNTSYQDLPSLNFMDNKERSEFMNSVEDSNIPMEYDHKAECISRPNFVTKYSEFSSSRETSEPKFESIETFIFDVKKDIDRSKVYPEPTPTEMNPYEKYKFKEDFYKITKNSPRFRKSYEIISDSFESARNYLKDSNKLLNSEYSWDNQKYSDFKYGIKPTESYRHDKIESTPIKRGTTVSAFETDPDILLLQKNGLGKESLSPLTKKYLAHKNVQLPDTKCLDQEKYSMRHDRKFDDDFLNIISLKIKKNGSESIDDEGKENSILNETIESEHLYSDYAKGPVFPTEVYGSRPRVELAREGIYTRKKKEVKINVPEPIQDESLNAEQLKQMDKKLKKMIKKNLKEDLKSHIVNFETNPETFCWDIPVDKKYQNNVMNESSSTITQNDASTSVPYLPLRDVPVHDLVKKLRHEFELDKDLSFVSSGLDDIYHRFHKEYSPKKVNFDMSSTERFSEKKSKNNLENFVKNPVKAFIDNIDQRPEGNLDKIVEVDTEREYKPEENQSRKLISKKFIEDQKKRHEKRIKKLDKLINLEKDQVEKLKKLLSLDQHDSMYTSIFESYVQKNSDFDEEDEFLNISDRDHQNERVEENTEYQEFESSIEEEDIEEKKQVLEESGIESSESGSEKKVEKKTFEKSKISSWFCPIQPVKQKQEVPKPPPKEKKAEKFEVKLENPEDTNSDPFSRKIGLQEAFQVYKYDFLKNSRNRVKEIKIKAARRQVVRDLKIDNLAQLDAKLSKVRYSNKQKEQELLDDKKINYFTIDKAMFSKNRHIMSSQEIVEQTKKKYQKLPEVQQKKLKQKLEENKIRNRIKSNLFKKTIQQKVLSSGPNFNLNYKALESQL